MVPNRKAFRLRRRYTEQCSRKATSMLVLIISVLAVALIIFEANKIARRRRVSGTRSNEVDERGL